MRYRIDPAHSLVLNTSALGGTTNMSPWPRRVVIVFTLHVPNWPEVIYFTLPSHTHDDTSYTVNDFVNFLAQLCSALIRFAHLLEIVMMIKQLEDIKISITKHCVVCPPKSSAVSSRT